MKRLKLFCGIFALTIVASVNAWIANETIALNSELSLPDVEQIAEGEDYEMNGFWDFWTYGFIKNEEKYDIKVCPRHYSRGIVNTSSSNNEVGATVAGYGANVGTGYSNSNSDGWTVNYDEDQNPGYSNKCKWGGYINCDEIDCWHP
jgi:hypothetical protein